MDSAFVIGGTRFIGRHVVADLLAHEYEVTIFNRGTHENPFAETAGVSHIEGDRTDVESLEAAAERTEPAIVVDCVAYKPREVRTATRVFEDADAYVYISSGSAYGAEEIPKREGVTELCTCTADQETDDSMASYGPRKAEGDRAVFEAAERGVNAMSVRPTIVYGPYDYTERQDYWIDRVDRYDRLVVPGDGTNIWHRAYAEDVASAIRIVGERGDPGEAYNVGDQRVTTLEEMVHLIAEALETDVEVVHASARELSVVGLAPEDFILYREYPHILDTNKLAALGWESTPPREATARTVREHLESDRDGSEHDSGRGVEERLIEVLETV